MDLNIIWFILVAVLLTGYAALDGFDLGVGIISLFTKKSEDRRILMNSIGPLWDGNEVWILTGGGAIFAAFPHVYATVFSGFYLALMLLLLAMIFRAISMEFRSKVESVNWQLVWDRAFGISSLLIALLLGVALGNIAQGLPVEIDKNIRINLFQLLTPYPLVIGLLTVVLFALHGALFSLNKTVDDLRASIKELAQKTYWVFLILYGLATLLTFVMVPNLVNNYNSFAIWYVVPLIGLVLILLIPSQIKKNNYKMSFTFSFLVIIMMMTTFAIGLFPNMVPAHDVANSLNIYNSSSSQKTLTVMLIIALIGMPAVVGYTIWVNKVFRGKVVIDDTSY